MFHELKQFLNEHFDANQTIGPYVFLNYLYSGNFGEIWKCSNLTTGDTVMCKIFYIESCKNPEYYAHLQNKLMVYSKLSHPNIAKLLDVITDDEKIYIFIEYYTNGSLNDIVMSTNGNGLPEDKARHYFKQIMQALFFIHRMGVAHRDLKLENIVITNDDNVKLTDFEMCKKQDPGNLSLTTCGTLLYVAPEIIKEEPYDGMKADIWSAGVVLYAMVSGHFPWMTDTSLTPNKMVHETAKQIISGEIVLPDDLSFELENLLFNILNVDPNERPTAEDILQHPWMEAEDDDFDTINTEPDVGLVNMLNELCAEIEKKIKMK